MCLYAKMVCKTLSAPLLPGAISPLAFASPVNDSENVLNILNTLFIRKP